MADDIRRHLSGHPVLARRQTVAYRTRRFVRRHRAGIAALATILVLLGTYAVTVTVQRERIRKALREATLGTQKAERVTDFMVGLFEASEAGKALTDSVTARELLGRGLMQARELSSQPEIQSQLLDVIGRLYTELADYDRARPVLEEALAIRRRLVGERHPDYVTTLENLAQVAGLRQEVDESVRLRSEVLSLRRELSGREDPKSLNALYSLGFALHRAGQDSAAWSLLDEWQDLLAKQPRSISERRASQLSDAAVLLELRGETERAEPLHREALAIRRELYGDSHHLVGESLVSLGTFLDNTRRAEAAEPLLHEAVTMFRGVYPDGHPRNADALRSWGISLLHLKRFR